MLLRLSAHGPLLAGLLALVVTQASPALGAGATEPIRIEYRTVSGAGCPSEAEFLSQVFARTKSARAANAGEVARTFIVELRRTGARVNGSLVIQETDGATMARRVSGTVCADVATVLALATALAIDPRAELAPRETLEEPTEPKAEPKEPKLPTSPPVEPPSSRDRRWAPRWALGPSVAFAVAPRAAFGASVLFALHRAGAPPLGEFGFEMVYRRTGAATVRDARAAFQFYAARPTLCVSGVALGGSLAAAPCFVFELGGVTGVGSEIPNAARRTRFWATGEAQLRLELELVASWFLTLEGGVASPLTRYRFVFKNPDTSIHRVPVLTMTTALRVGASF